jgi:hypothetical protein
MKKGLALIIGAFLVICLFLPAGSFAQIRDEEEEKTLRELALKKLPKPTTLKFYSQIGVFSGYDSNVKLAPIRKGDAFEELLYSLGVSKPLPKDFVFTFNYDLDAINYNEIRDASNILNHLRFAIHKKLTPFTLGAGYDLGVFYYPENEPGNFLLQKGFSYIRQNIFKNMYHQLMYEYGLKDHLDRKAISDTLTTLQDEKREDRRQAIEYILGKALTRRLSLKLKAKFSINDSNARFEDFYDYKTYEGSPGIEYRFSKRLDLFTSFSYLRRNYKAREVTLQDYKQKDNVYSANCGARYKLDKNNTLSILYIYRDNSSNESLERYTENLISCGWQYKF